MEDASFRVSVRILIRETKTNFKGRIFFAFSSSPDEGHEKRLIDDYIFFYNNQRIQTKTKLTPIEKRRQSVA